MFQRQPPNPDNFQSLLSTASALLPRLNKQGNTWFLESQPVQYPVAPNTPVSLAIAICCADKTPPDSAADSDPTQPRRPTSGRQPGKRQRKARAKSRTKRQAQAAT